MAQLGSALFYGSFFCQGEGSSYLNDFIFFLLHKLLDFRWCFLHF